jgi:hypothetical protein
MECCHEQRLAGVLCWVFLNVGEGDGGWNLRNVNGWRPGAGLKWQRVELGAVDLEGGWVRADRDINKLLIVKLALHAAI